MSTRTFTFAALVLFMALGIVGKIEADTEAAIAAERFDARIWSSRCAARGMDYIAKQADGKAWQVSCVRRDRT